MSGNGGFPPLIVIKKEENEKKERFFANEKKERFFANKKIVKINNIIEEVKNLMIDTEKEEIKIIDSF